MSGHTPGPWKLRPVSDFPRSFTLEVVAGDVAVAELECDARDAEAVDVVRADASLIAASPELLAALESAVQVIEQTAPKDVPCGVIDVVLFGARAAIAKARGGK